MNQNSAFAFPLAPHPVALHDCAPAPDDFRAEVLESLRQTPKSIACKYFYDARGSHLFDQICELDEYYPTRTERGILCEQGAAMAQALGPDCLLLDHLLDEGCDPVAYVPIDISREHLLNSARKLALEYAPLPVLPVCADYTQPFTLPEPPTIAARRVIYFPGPTIGNFSPQAAQLFLRQMAKVCGADGGLLIGVDLKKDPGLLHRAYNDAAGVTAAFNLNVLHRLNRELGADWPVQNFRHVAFYDHQQGRIEMHLESCCEQTLWLGEAPIHFRCR